jgi:hypothetical protein
MIVNGNSPRREEKVFDNFRHLPGALTRMKERKEHMEGKIASTLYIDLQAQVPAAFCPRCKGALYRPSLLCLRCGEGER